MIEASIAGLEVARWLALHLVLVVVGTCLTLLALYGLACLACWVGYGVRSAMGYPMDGEECE